MKKTIVGSVIMKKIIFLLLLFIGAFALKLSEGVNISESIEFAVGISALTVTKIGAQQSLPTIKELELFLERM